MHSCNNISSNDTVCRINQNSPNCPSNNWYRKLDANLELTNFCKRIN